MKTRRIHPRANLRQNTGLTLVELMISMALGAVVVGGVISVLVANKQTYRTNEALSQVQESARTAFEMLARDVRQAGLTGCDNTGRVANVLDPGVGLWWQTWFVMRGYDGAQTDPAVTTGTAVGQRVNGTDSIQVQGLDGLGLSVETHTPTSANFKINATTTNIAENDILMVCDFDHAAIFRVSNYNSANVTVVHNTGSGTPQNCSKGLGYPTQCTTVGNTYTFGPNSHIAKLGVTDWYIGHNGRADEGGRSLYRRKLTNGFAAEEVVAGVTDMQITYRLKNGADFIPATTAPLSTGDWSNVTSVSIALTFSSADRNVSTRSGVSSGRIERTFTHVITLRNRVQ